MIYKILAVFAVGFSLMACNFNQDSGKSQEQNSSLEGTSEQKREQDSEVEKNFTIKDRSAGIFEVGKQIPFPDFSENFSIRKEQQVRMTEEGPTEETVYIVNSEGRDELKLYPVANSATGDSSAEIGKIIVISEKYRTEEGIGVNSTLEDFINQYPVYKIWYTYVSDMYVVETDEVQVQFLLSEEDFTGEMKVESVMTPLRREDFKKNARIQKIRMI